MKGLEVFGWLLLFFFFCCCLFSVGISEHMHSFNQLYDTNERSECNFLVLNLSCLSVSSPIFFFRHVPLSAEF